MAISTVQNDPHIIEKHWSHEHPLEQLQYTIVENDHDDYNYDSGVMICDGCIQPISVSHPSYYACIDCGFFLHSFCATKLPQELPEGASPFHPLHSLFLRKSDRFCSFATCNVCASSTNGFYYECEDCDIIIDIRCAFLPIQIKHKSHKHHPLVQRPTWTKSVKCSVSKLQIADKWENVSYECKTCYEYQIHIDCAFYPSKIRHKYDLHPITLRLPPFFYEGVFYCQICEEQVNNQLWLYHCDECDQSFHYNCVRWNESVKLGGTIKLYLDDEPHTLALVLKRSARKNSPEYFCMSCSKGYKWNYFFECDACGFLVCCKCVKNVMDE